MDKKAIEQEIKVAADDLVDTVKKFVREGNVRRIVVRNAEGRTLVDMPLTAGVAGALLLPFFTMLTGSSRSSRSSRSWSSDTTRA